MKKKMKIVLWVGLFSMLLAACSDTKTAKINGKEKTVSREFVDIVTKRHEDKIKLALPLTVKPVYTIVYKGEEIKVFHDHGDGLVRNKSDWYQISTDEYEIIENEAN